MRLPAFLLACACLGSSACSTGAPGDDRNGAATSADTAGTVTLRYTTSFILDKVLERKHQTFDPQKPMPEIRFASQTTLQQFQDDIEPQWGTRPDAITNAFIIAKNVIYVMDDASYYATTHRCIDDSLAHELTHYVQMHYLGWVIDGADDSIEADAIEVQTWFRETYCQGA